MLPTDFTQRFEQLCPAHLYELSLASFKKPKKTAFRINSLHPLCAQTLPQLKELRLDMQSVSWAEEHGIEAFLCRPEQRELLTYSPLVNSGQVYVQGLSSMVAPMVLSPQTTDWVLDLAAAPGSKTTLLAQLMANQGTISAVEPVKSRFFKLKSNLERMGVTNTRLYQKDGRAVGGLKPNHFDRVLLDAPCSSESLFRMDDPSSFEHWNLNKVSECAKKQKRLILSAFDALKSGGIMLYCTCSFSPEENEEVVTHLLKKREGVHLQGIEGFDLANMTSGLNQWNGKSYAPECSLTRRIWPTDEMDGFFLALVHKA